MCILSNIQPSTSMGINENSESITTQSESLNSPPSNLILSSYTGPVLSNSSETNENSENMTIPSESLNLPPNNLLSSYTGPVLSNSNEANKNSESITIPSGSLNSPANKLLSSYTGPVLSNSSEANKNSEIITIPSGSLNLPPNNLLSSYTGPVLSNSSEANKNSGSITIPSGSLNSPANKLLSSYTGPVLSNSSKANKNSESITIPSGSLNSPANKLPSSYTGPVLSSTSETKEKFKNDSKYSANKHHRQYYEAINSLPPNLNRFPTRSSPTISQLETNIKPLPYSEMVKATDNFNSKNLLGKGGYGEVFKGTHITMSVAVKVLTHYHERSKNSYIQKFSLNEIEFLIRYRHDNILPLYQYSIDDQKLCLMCKFMSNGSLYDLLRKGETEPLPWLKRVTIANGVAKGLQFLHQMNPPLYHGDIKSPNILLDEYLEAKICDFGLAREGPQQLTRIYGTAAYLPPAYSKDKKLTAYIDIFSYAVVLFELATGLKPQDKYDSTQNIMFLRDHVKNYVETGRIMDLVDPNVKQGSDVAQSLIILGLECIKDQPDQTPNMMNYVIKKLEMLHDEIKYFLDLFDCPRQGLDPQIYDVFILYVREDYSCAEHIREMLTVHYNLKVFNQSVDLVEGRAFDTSSIVAKFMDKRCHKIIVILSEAFSKSTHHVSLFEYAYSNTYQNGCIKVIPCISKGDNIPPKFRQHFSLNYEFEGESDAFWERLNASIISRKKGLVGFQKSTEDNNDTDVPFERPKCFAKKLISKFLALICLKSCSKPEQ